MSDSSSSESSPRQKIKAKSAVKSNDRETVKQVTDKKKKVPEPVLVPLSGKQLKNKKSKTPETSDSSDEHVAVHKKKSVTKIECSDSSSSEEKIKKKEKEKETKVAQQNLKNSIQVTMPVEFFKGEKLVKRSGDYTVKPDDTFVVLTGSKPQLIKLFSIAEGRQEYHISKRVTIKSIGKLQSHTIECGKGNCFDEDPTRTTIAFAGGDVVRLQSAGKSWITV